MGEIGDLDVFGDAAEPRHVGLHEMHRAGGEEGVERVERVELLAERDRDGGRARERRVRGDVVVPERLLEPEDVELLGPRAETLAGRQVPFAVAVHRDADVVADRAAHGAQARDILRRIVMPDLHLEAAEPVALDRVACRARRAGRG